MRGYVLRSETGAFAVSTEDSGKDLPAASGSWSRYKEIALDEACSCRIALAPDEVATLRRDRFVLLENGLVIDDA